MKRKIILIEQKNIIECDNENCDYVIPNTDPNLNPPGFVELSKYVNMKCPKCSENLLTGVDYEKFISFIKTVERINKWWGWLTFFYSPEKVEYQINKIGEWKVHNGINIKHGKE